MIFSKDEVEAIVKQKLSFLESEEAKTNTEDFRFPLIYNVFDSKFGKEFEEKCRDLTLFTEIAMLTISSVNKGKKLQKFYEEMLDETIKKTLEEDEDSDAKKIIDALLPVKSLIFSKDSSDSKDSSTNVISKKGFRKLKVTQRCSAYYIFAFYAYIDVYLVDLFNNYFKKKLPEDLLQDFPDRGGIKERTRSLLQIIRKDLPEQLNQFYKNHGGLDDKSAYELLIDTRHEIAHANPLPELKKLRNKFRKQYSKAKDKRDSLIENIIGFKLFDEEDDSKNVLLSPEMKKTISNFAIILFKDIHLAFFFVEIGLSCIRYLSIIEEIVSYF